MKIVALIRPFETFQTIFIYDEGDKIEEKKILITVFTENICNIIEKYNIDEITFSGPKAYGEKFEKEINKFYLTKYNKNLKINYV